MSARDSKVRAVRAAEIKGLRANMGALLKRFQTLAKHPDYPQKSSPNIHLNNQVKLPADYEGMMGMMVLSGVALGAVGGAFNGAANQNFTPSSSPSVFDYTLDIIDEIRKDRSSKPQKDDEVFDDAYGKGSLARYEHKSICNIFNKGDEDAAHEAALEAYNLDRNEHIRIEKSLRYYDHVLSSLQRDQALALAL